MTSQEWSRIQQGIFAGESGGDYGALFNYQNRPDGRFSGVDLTKMTVDQALDFASPSGPYAQYVKGQVGRVATPMGAYQIVGTTLRDAKRAMGLKGDEVLTPQMQDQIGQWIYKTQGTGAWEGYKNGTESRTMTPQDEPRGLLGSLGIQKMEEGAAGETGQRFYERDSFKDTAATLAQGFAAMGSMPGLQKMANDVAEQRSENKARNKTVEYLRKNGRGDLADMVEQKLIGAGAAAAEMLKKPDAGELRELKDGSLVRVMKDNTVVPISSGGPDKGEVASLRKEFTGAQEVKSFVPIARQYANIISAASGGTGPDDISLVFSYMKLLDPTSSVQQGEQATAGNAAGAPSKIRSLYNQLVGGGNLDNNARDQFAAAATKLYENAKKPYEAKASYYRKLAEQYGYDPENVVPQVGYSGPEYVPWSQRPPLAAVNALKANPSQAMMDEFDKKYGAGAAARELGR